MALARSGNAYFDATKPFLTRKDNSEACGRAINVCLQTCRILTTLIAPFLPFTAERCAGMLNLAGIYSVWSLATEELPAEHVLGPPVILVKKLDPKELLNG